MAEFTARYKATCASCFDTIEVGDQARYDSQDQVIHAECRERLPQVTVTCPTCFMALPLTGVCDDCG